MNQDLQLINDDEISIKEIVIKIKSWAGYLKSQWLKILTAGIIGGVIGYVYAFYQPVTYTAKLSFIVEDAKSSGMGGLSSLAGLAGFDIGGASGGGLLSGENLLLFLKSNSLIKTTLLTPYDSVKNYSLADKYADEYELRSKWAKNKKINTTVFFPVQSKLAFTRLQDSLLQILADKILKKELIIERPEKKATFINVQATMQDEMLSKFFCERLVNKAIDRYIISKITRQKTSVDKLQRRSDSLGALLNYKTFSSAIANEKILDINPAYRSSTVNAEVVGRDKLMIGTIYGEVVKNLEIAKVQLSQETPTIQVVDEVDLPLKIVKISKLISLIIGGLIGGGILIGYLSIKNIK